MRAMMMAKMTTVAVVAAVMVALAAGGGVTAASAARTYWVIPNGTASWSDSRSATPLNGAACSSLGTANKNASAGDTVYLRAGTYGSASDNISPAHSGTSWLNQIVFSAYNNEQVTITSQFCPNRTMEQDTGWNDCGSPITNERSSAQAYKGEYSRTFSVDAAGEGIQSDAFATVPGGYIYSAWVYSTEPGVNVQIHNGAGIAVDADVSIRPNRWCVIRGRFEGSAPGSYIAFRSPAGTSSGTWYVDNVRITRNQAGIDLSGNDYIKVHGVDFKAVMRGFQLENGSDGNEISSCTFTDLLNEYYFGVNIISNAGGRPCNYNWIHHCTIYDNGHVNQGGDDVGSAFRVGANRGNSSYNLVEDNVFYHSAHDLLLLASPKNTVRNNVFHNEGYIKDLYGDCENTPGPAGFGNRNIADDMGGRAVGRHLIEGNRLGYAGTPPDDDGSVGLAITSRGNIVRYNFMYGNGGSGMYWKGASSDNRFYSNTVYRNGGGEDIRPFRQSGIVFGNKKAMGNVMTNNIVYKNTSTDIKFKNNASGNPASHNWLTGDGDPLFVSPDMSDKMSLTLPDLSLRANSGAIDKGAALTTVSNADTGAGRSLMVADASYFQDGTWAPPGKIEADWLAVGTVGNTVQIASIDYEAKAITLAKAISRKGGDPVWLYRDSSGRRVLYGAAPDIGAHEFGSPPAQRAAGRMEGKKAR